jgi:hypothetical protein
MVPRVVCWYNILSHQLDIYVHIHIVLAWRSVTTRRRKIISESAAQLGSDAREIARSLRVLLVDGSRFDSLVLHATVTGEAQAYSGMCM